LGLAFVVKEISTAVNPIAAEFVEIFETLAVKPSVKFRLLSKIRFSRFMWTVSLNAYPIIDWDAR